MLGSCYIIDIGYRNSVKRHLLIVKVAAGAPLARQCGRWWRLPPVSPCTGGQGPLTIRLHPIPTTIPPSPRYVETKFLDFKYCLVFHYTSSYVPVLSVLRKIMRLIKDRSGFIS